MAFISSRLFVAGGNKKLLSLTNEEHVRYIGSDWSALRVGILCAITANGTSNVTGRLSLGVCSGQTNPCGTNPTTSFAGHRTVTPGTWTYNSNSGDPYFSQDGFYGLGRTGNTDTIVNAGNGNQSIVSTAPGNGGLQRRSIVLVDVNKPSSGSTFPYYTAAAQMANDYSYADFLAAMEWPDTSPIVRGSTMSGSTPEATPVSDTNGVLNNVDILWTGVSQALEIYAIAVYRKS